MPIPQLWRCSSLLLGGQNFHCGMKRHNWVRTTRRLMPEVMVTGRSVLLRNVKHGTSRWWFLLEYRRSR